MPPKQASKGGKKEPSKKPMKPKEGGGKAKKKKWSKGKVRDKLANMVLFDHATFEKLLKEVPQYKNNKDRLVVQIYVFGTLTSFSWMRLNQETVLETSRLFMVPYLRIYVPKYHSWMQDSWLRASTSSEQLTLDEEFEAQEQWCHLDDRLTFILLSKQLYQDYWLLNNNKTDTIESQLNNYENAEIFSMIGDVNLFITYSHMVNDFEGELSVMIAESKYRGQGLAAEALAGILEYSGRHLPMKLNSLVAKVSMTNESSIHFFQNRLNFIERSRNTIFNE
ncbi:unnamed protein product [Schistosoma haematobium]|nr:unnamed protein product [Schistosoma haematobium]